MPNYSKIITMLRRAEYVIQSNGILSSCFDPQDKSSVIELIHSSCPESIAPLAISTLSFHADCIEKQLNDGRRYWKYCAGSNCVAISGLHHRIWEPQEIWWGGWFCAATTLTPKIKVSILFDTLNQAIRIPDLRHLYLEVYAGTDDSNIYNIYKKFGLNEYATLPNFYGIDKGLVLMSVDINILRQLLDDRYLLLH